MIRNCDKGHACVDGFPFVCPWCAISARDAEIERLKKELESLEKRFTDLRHEFVRAYDQLAAMTKERDELVLAFKGMDLRLGMIEELEQALANERKAVEWAADRCTFYERYGEPGINLSADEIRKKTRS